MTFPSGISKFDEELSWVKSYFEKWSHSERAIAVCSLLKQFQHPTLRFINSKLEATFTKCMEGERNKWMEQKANNKTHITELCDSYKLLTNTTTTDVQLNNNKDSGIYESDRKITSDNSSSLITHSTTSNTSNLSNNNTNSVNLNVILDKCNTKEDFLREILNCILMLKIGNDDVIQEYLALIPFMVDDTHRRIVNIDMVMQTLSVLVAHPALSTDDLRTVKEHIERLKNIIHSQNGEYLNTDWQAIAKPNVFKPHSTNIFSSLSSVGSSQVQAENLYDTPSDYIETDTGSAGRSSGGGSDLFIPYTSLSTNRRHITADEQCGFLTSTTNEQNISFSKNGTDVPDFNPELDHTNNHFNIYFESLAINPIVDSTMLKTRRSNSLTTGGLKHHEQFGTAFTSTENLLHGMHKPRSYSLSIDNQRSLLQASGSETRLDDLKPTYQSFQSQNPGMKYVGAWLKRLRLHKYADIFLNISFEQMMDINDEFLETLSVTQGARTKLVNSIHKLKERHCKLVQTDQELKAGKITITAAIEVLMEIVVTPMKPAEVFNPIDVASQFLNVFAAVCNIVLSKKLVTQDEEIINQLVHVFDIAQLENSEPFASFIFELRDLRYNIEALKLKFLSASHFHKNGNGVGNGNPNKTRWSSLSKPHNKNGNDIKPHRKNSNPMSNFNFAAMQQVQSKQKQPHPNNGIGSKINKKGYMTSNNFHQSVNNYSKSSSYPNFSSNNSTGNNTNSTNQQYAINNQNPNAYHWYSVNNLVPITTNASMVTASMPQHQKTSSGLQLSSQTTPHTTINSTTSTSNSLSTSAMLSHINALSNYNKPKQITNRAMLGDMSPYKELEFLSLQMTEQAIN